jgi:hypothetical protein
MTPDPRQKQIVKIRFRLVINHVGIEAVRRVLLRNLRRPSRSKRMATAVPGSVARAAPGRIVRPYQTKRPSGTVAATDYRLLITDD